MKAKRKSPETLPFRVSKGALTPNDGYVISRLRERGFRVGDVVFVTMTKGRNPGYHRLAHAFGKLVSENIDAFGHMDPHEVLKRLQIEANVGCDEIALIFPGLGPSTYRIPRSLSFENMDQSEFEHVFKGLAHHVAKTYWPSLTEERIEQMASLMPEAT